jgi:hypothetical protein
MAQTKAELLRERELLRKRVKENQALRQQVARNREHLQDAFNAVIETDEAARQDLQKLKLRQSRSTANDHEP